MSQRTPLFFAVGFGIVTVGALWLLSFHAKDSLAPRVVDQTMLADDGAPPHMRIDLEPSRELSDLAAVGNRWTYRIIDDQGHVYFSQDDCDEKTRRLLVPIVYGHQAIHPRLEVLLDDRSATVPLEALPLPRIESLKVDGTGLLRAYRASSAQQAEWGGGTLRIVPLFGSPATHRLDLSVLRTSIVNQPAARIAQRLVDGSCVFAVPDVDVVGQVTVRAVQFRLRSKDTFVRIPMRLVKRDGQTVVGLLRDHVSLPDGYDLHLVSTPPDWTKQAHGPKDAQGDVREPILVTRLTVRPTPLVVPVPQDAATRLTALPGAPENPDSDVPEISPDWKRSSIQSLNLLGFRFDSLEWSGRGDVTRPVATKPFTFVLRMRRHWSETVRTVRETIPVESPR